MNEKFRPRVTIMLFLLLCSLGSLASIWEVSDWGDKLATVDAGSEANTLRAVRHFLEDGVAKYYGLGNQIYPGMYPDDGATPASFAKNYEPGPELDYILHHALSPEGVYTHYPPGPEYLMYAEAKLFGLAPVWRLRLLPIAIGWAAMVFLGLSIRCRFGPAAGWLVMAALAITPTVNNGFVCLHSQGYDFALLLFEIGIAIRSGTSVVPFAVLGFLQGWLSFDYVFLVSLTPLAIEAAMPRIDPGCQSRWKLAWRRVVLAGAGFACAHILHFAQVWAYWGDFTTAFNDIGTAALHRSGNETTSGLFGHAVMADQLMNNYYLGVHPLSLDVLHVDPDRSFQWLTFRFLGLSLGPWWLLITVTLAVRQFLIRAHNASELADGWLRVSLVGILTSSAWFMVMVNHGAMHQFYLYRHLFLAFFISVLFGSVTFCRYRFKVPGYDLAAQASA